MKWRLAGSIQQLVVQLTALAPDRDKKSDGTIGDSAHASRQSDHNPNHEGVVTAIDVTHDPEHGVDGDVLSQQLTVDVRTKYVIWNGRIWKARTRQWETYRGPNPHQHHVHLSVSSVPSLYDNLSDWHIALAPPVTKKYPVLRLGARGQEVRVLQEKLHLTIDGVFGALTEAAVKGFQSLHGLKADGIVGPNTWKALNA